MDDFTTDNYAISVCKTCSHDNNTNCINIKHRMLCSHMILSHIPMIIPCIWWIFGYNTGTHMSHCVDKIMAVVLTSSILISSVYHYYYECVLHTIEANVLILNTLMLNIYMYYRGVHYAYIAAGGVILYGLHRTIHSIERNDKLSYERNHPFCHYIAGVYVTACVYLIQQTYIADTCSNIDPISNVIVAPEL